MTDVIPGDEVEILDHFSVHWQILWRIHLFYIVSLRTSFFEMIKWNTLHRICFVVKYCFDSHSSILKLDRNSVGVRRHVDFLFHLPDTCSNLSQFDQVHISHLVYSATWFSTKNHYYFSMTHDEWILCQIPLLTYPTFHWFVSILSDTPTRSSISNWQTLNPVRILMTYSDHPSFYL